ncbi:MAG: hypothetical protein NE327_21220 [Lentisphaeraceae bacterium]|nr:hypothetical protein [Lentisphaeraceae bacterium]
MAFEFVHFEDLAEPLTDDRNLQSCQVAGMSLKQLQEKYLAPLENTEGTVFIRSNAWLGTESVKELLNGSSKIVADGIVLASLNKDELAQESSEDSGLEDCFEIKYAWDLLRINELVISAMAQDDIKGKVYDSAVIEGKVQIGAGTKILPGVYIEGNVIIGEDCKVGPNCYIRGNTFIGDGCHVGQSVEIKNSILMDKTNVGHLSYVGDSVLGTRVNFGAGTTTSNLRHDNQNHHSMIQGELVNTGRRKFGVIIGDGVHTGINTSFYPGRKMWPGTTTLPGEIVSRDKK